MSSWETGDDDRAACPVLSLIATPWSWCEQPADRPRIWRCCIKRWVRSASNRAPKSPAACCGMTVLCRSSPAPEVRVARLCHPSRAPSPLLQQFRCHSARPRGRAAGRPACRWPTSCSRLSKPAGDGSTARGSARWSALAPKFIDGKLQERDDYERKFGGAPPAKAVNRQVRWLGGIQWLHQRQATTAMTT